MPETTELYDITGFLNIIFGAVGVTSLVLALFAIWLSWQFYKESRAQNDKVNETVLRIETTISAVQAHIEQIVQKTIDNLLSTQESPSEEVTDEALAGLTDLREKISELERKKDHPDLELVSELRALVINQEKQIEQLARTTRENQFRRLFAVPSIKAVSTLGEITQKSDNHVTGMITLKVRRPVPVATGTAKLSQGLGSSPDINVELIDSPDGSDVPTLHFGIGSGPKADELNVHLNAASGSVINPGEYQIKYEAKSA